jgi:hypothetical protein
MRFTPFFSRNQRITYAMHSPGRHPVAQPN